MLQAGEKARCAKRGNRFGDEGGYLFGILPEAPRADYRIEWLRVDISNRAEDHVDATLHHPARRLTENTPAERLISRPTDRHLGRRHPEPRLPTWPITSNT